MRAAIVCVFACTGVLFWGETQRAPMTPSVADFVDPLSAPEISVEYSKGRIRLAGSSASDEHETVLRLIVAEQFAGSPARFDFQPSILPGAQWEAASARLVYLLAASDTAIATLRPRAVSVRGVTSVPDVFRSRLRFLREELPADAEMWADVLTVTARTSFDALCARTFDSLFLQPVTFYESSADIRDSSLVTLDRITEFARDCPGATIAIRGHTDASGDETWNQKLSLARARAVAERIVANGIDPNRLIVSGVGSAEPIADNSTSHGRQANRRIEFELR